jgi:putative PIN family toxin of toxin-antitoxin system
MNQESGMRVKRFVLDTNIWISYLITRREQDLLRAKVAHKLSLFICDELLTEFQRVLDYLQVKKYGINNRDAISFVKSFTIHFELQSPIKEYLPGDQNDKLHYWPGTANQFRLYHKRRPAHTIRKKELRNAIQKTSHP